MNKISINKVGNYFVDKRILITPIFTKVEINMGLSYNLKIIRMTKITF